MTIVLILLLALAGVVAAWALAEAARQRRKAKEAEARAVAAGRQMKRMQEAYAREADRLEELGRGSNAERVDASVRILRELARGANGSD